MSIQSTLQKLKQKGIPAAYGRFKKRQDLPFLVYMSTGQWNEAADNTYYYSRNSYQLEYYFKEKDEAKERAIEEQLIEDGYLYDKSDDVYIEEEDVFVIYYNV